MLHLHGSRKAIHCDGIPRRDFLKVGALGLGGFLLPDLLRARAAATPGRPARDASVVWLWLAGGPSQIETFDPKPDVPVEFRTVVGAVQTRLPGVLFGGVLPKMARYADRLAVVRSFAHEHSQIHDGAAHWVMTGYRNPAAERLADVLVRGSPPPSRPAIGAIVSRYRGANNPHTGVPTYVRAGREAYADGASWLGLGQSPFPYQDSKARDDMRLQVTADNLGDRRRLLAAFDSINRSVDQSGVMAAADDFHAQAFDLLLRGRALNAFDLNRENPRVRERYGKGLGEQMLLARRLCEAGAGFVTVNFGGWDMHNTIVPGMKELGPQLDHAVSAFLEDTTSRGLEKDILLVITGEFGRAPRITTGGRDHWAPLSTLCLAGGGLKMGQVVGESNSKGESPKTTPISPQDLMATVFHVLGLPQDLQYRDPSGRPTPMIDGGKPIADLV